MLADSGVSTSNNDDLPCQVGYIPRRVELGRWRVRLVKESPDAGEERHARLSVVTKLWNAGDVLLSRSDINFAPVLCIQESGGFPVESDP